MHPRPRSRTPPGRSDGFETKIHLCTIVNKENIMSNELTKVYKLSALTAAAAMAAATAIALVGAALS